jgi:hypothetical protein
MKFIPNKPNFVNGTIAFCTSRFKILSEGTIGLLSGQFNNGNRYRIIDHYCALVLKTKCYFLLNPFNVSTQPFSKTIEPGKTNKFHKKSGIVSSQFTPEKIFRTNTKDFHKKMTRQPPQCQTGQAFADKHENCSANWLPFQRSLCKSSEVWRNSSRCYACLVA